MTIPKSPSLKGFRPGDARRVRFVQPELVAEVEFRSWTADGLIRHSTFRGLREDKPAEKAALESEAAPASAKQGRGVIDTFLGAIFLGLTIALMHYSGMEATRFLSGSAMEEDLALLWSEKYLAFAITVTIYGACSTCLVVFSFLIWKPHWTSESISPTTPGRDANYGKVADAVIEQIRFLGRTIERQKLEKHPPIK